MRRAGRTDEQMQDRVADGLTTRCKRHTVLNTPGRENKQGTGESSKRGGKTNIDRNRNKA